MKRPIDLRIVLVRSIYERNVGATSRAMANMGLEHLILIAPQCQFTIEAHRAAANGQSPLEKKIVYSSWDEFYKNEPRGLQIATTARDGRGRQVQDLEATFKQILKQSPDLNLEDTDESDSDLPLTLHLVFGPEDWGLSAGDIQYANFCCSIPTYGENTSLNLAQAVLLALFIFRSVFGGERSQLEGQQKPRGILKKLDIFPEATLKKWLEAMNIDISSRRMNAFTVLRRLLLQNTPTEKEFRILEMTLQQSIRKMEDVKESKRKK